MTKAKRELLARTEPLENHSWKRKKNEDNYILKFIFSRSIFHFQSCYFHSVIDKT